MPLSFLSLYASETATGSGIRRCDLNPASFAASFMALVLIGLEFAGTQITACSTLIPSCLKTDTLKSFRTSAERSSGYITREEFSNLKGIEKPILFLNSDTALLSCSKMASLARTPTSIP